MGGIKRKNGRKCEAPQACRNQRRRNSLAAANEKVTSITANEERIRQVTWLYRLTQSAASSISVYRLKTIPTFPLSGSVQSVQILIINRDRFQRRHFYKWRLLLYVVPLHRGFLGGSKDWFVVDVPAPEFGCLRPCVQS